MRNKIRALALLSVLSLVATACSANATPSPVPVTPAPVTQAPQATPVPVTPVPATAVPVTPVPATATPEVTPPPSQTAVTEYPRNETIYTSGTQYGPPNSWNPIFSGGYAMGTLGLLYEPLFMYDPLAADQTKAYTPWLADASSGWTGDKEYTIKLRDGITWSDGQPLNADDVVFTLNLGKLPSVPYSTIWDFLDTVTKVDNLTVKLTFKVADYQQWANFLYNQAIVPAHLWTGTMDTDATVSGPNANPIGSGPYMFLTADQDRMVWQKNDNWWGKTPLGLDPKPKYIVDLVNGGNNVMLGLVLQGQIDLSNNFLPGVASLVSGIGGYGLQTYYDKPPYMMSANTAWMVPNTTKPPLNDAKFRHALAESIDTSAIVNNVYGNIVKAADPTGLLPIWDQFIDKDLVSQFGFKYDVDKAKADLAAAGYKAGSDGFVTNLDGSPIQLSLIVPTGWSDWEESIRSIAASAQAAGINVVADTTNDYNARTDKIQQGNFDLAIMNDQQMSNTPWTYYNWAFRQPIQTVQNTASGNLERYTSDAAWKAVQDLDHTKTDDIAGMKTILSTIEKIQLQDLPMIPLWYNGVWSQANNSVWTNWPSDATYHVIPATWRGYWQMGGLKMLDQIKLVPPAGQ